MTSDQTTSPDDLSKITGVDDLLHHAYEIEREAKARYLDLADQMATHNNAEAEAMFRKLAEIEGKHADELAARLEDKDYPDRAPWQFLWMTPESPESADPGDVHYLMTPYHILTIALKGEEFAVEFFEKLAATAESDAVRELAGELAEEEREHVRMVKELLARYPAPPEDWDEDPDPPVSVE